MADEKATLPALAEGKRKGSRRYPRTGSQTGVRGVAAAALLQEGRSITEVAAAVNLHRDTVAAIRHRWAEGLKHIEPIRKVIQDVGLLTAAELLFGISERDIAAMPIEKHLDAAAKFMDRYAAPQRDSQQPPWLAVLQQYNVTVAPTSTNQPTLDATARREEHDTSKL